MTTTATTTRARRSTKAAAEPPKVEEQVVPEEAAEIEAVAADLVAEVAAQPAPSNVIAALHGVMCAVKSVGKDGFNEQNRFNFRGIDGVLNAVGPALRQVGLVVLPTLLENNFEQVETGRNGTRMNFARVTVRFDFYGPGGILDTVPVIVPGEAFDSGDKATSKAMSVAFRTALIQSLALPTQERDPDADSHEITQRPTGEEVKKAIQDAAIAARDADADPIDAIKGAATELGGKEVLSQITVHTTDGAGDAWSWVNYLVTREEQRRAAENRAEQQQAAAGEESQAPAQDAPAQPEDAPAAQDEARAQDPAREAEGARAPEPEPAQQPAQQPEAQRAAVAAQATEDARAQAPADHLRDQVIEELGEQAKVLGINPAEHVATLVQSANAQFVREVEPMRAQLYAASQRPKVIAALREQGRSAEADAYSKVPASRAGRWADLTGTRNAG